jgi:hypothetical protein
MIQAWGAEPFFKILMGHHLGVGKKTFAARKFW